MKNKLDSYNKATAKLVLETSSIDFEHIGNFSLPEIVSMLRESFKYNITYKNVFGEIRKNNDMPSTGFCLVSSYYINLKSANPEKFSLLKNPLHWWLEDNNNLSILDITYDQFPKDFPYHLKEPETRIKTDEDFQKIIYEKAMILGKCAGLE